MHAVSLELGVLVFEATLHGCGGATAGARPRQQQPPSPPALDDAQVALVLIATNRGEVTTANAAEPNLRLPAIDDDPRAVAAFNRPAGAIESAALRAETVRARHDRAARVACE